MWVLHVELGAAHGTPHVTATATLHVEAVTTCPCGWTVTAEEYFQSKRKRDLHGSCPAYADYVDRFRRRGRRRSA